MFRNKRGQNTAEYAVVIALVVGAAVAMQTYVKRNVQAGVKYTVDKLGKTGDKTSTPYEPYYLQSDMNTTTGSYLEIVDNREGGGITRSFGNMGGGTKDTTTQGSQVTLDTTYTNKGKTQ